jgi:hypothetical protein
MLKISPYYINSPKQRIYFMVDGTNITLEGKGNTKKFLEDFRDAEYFNLGKVLPTDTNIEEKILFLKSWTKLLLGDN